MKAKMAGDIGDCIMAMPCFRALGGGELLLHSERWTREPMTIEKARSIRSLLITQPYITDVRFMSEPEHVDVNLNDFRAEYFRTFKHPDFPKQRNLCEWILKTHGCGPEHQHTQWLHVEPNPVARVIINRTGPGRHASHVYHNYRFPWGRIVKKYAGEIIFLGTEAEWIAFDNAFGRHGGMQWIPTRTLLEMAQVIAGADLFIGNQSCAYAIAEGLKKPAILEVCPWLPNCLFHRPDVIHGWDGDIDLPPLKDSGGRSVSGESTAGFSLPIESATAGERCQSSEPANDL